MTTYYQTFYVVSTNFPGSNLQATYGHLLVQASYSHFNRFSNSGQTSLASFNKLLKYCKEFSFQYNELQYYRACVRSKAYTVLFARKGSRFSYDTSRTYLQSLQTLSVKQFSIGLLWYSSGRVVIGDTLPKSNTRLG